MSIIDTLITDRTQADVDLVRQLNAKWVPGSDGRPQWTGTTDELSRWHSGLKGAYNASDLNRVGAAVEYLTGRLNALGYIVATTPRTDWTVADVLTRAQLEDYLRQVSVIRSVRAVYPTTPAVPVSLVNATYQEANAIEQILADVEQLIQNTIAAWFYCGEVYCGEV